MRVAKALSFTPSNSAYLGTHGSRTATLIRVLTSTTDNDLVVALSHRLAAAQPRPDEKAERANVTLPLAVAQKLEDLVARSGLPYVDVIALAIDAHRLKQKEGNTL